MHTSQDVLGLLSISFISLSLFPDVSSIFFISSEFVSDSIDCDFSFGISSQNCPKIVELEIDSVIDPDESLNANIS